MKISAINIILETLSKALEIQAFQHACLLFVNTKGCTLKIGRARTTRNRNGKFALFFMPYLKRLAHSYLLAWWALPNDIAHKSSGGSDVPGCSRPNKRRLHE